MHLPDPHDWQRHVGEDGPYGGGEYSGEEVLDGVGVDGGGGDGRGPLVVLLVDVLVQRLVVQQPSKMKCCTSILSLGFINYRALLQGGA